MNTPQQFNEAGGMGNLDKSDTSKRQSKLRVTLGDENTSDGYHTFKELYEFRLLYNAALFNAWGKHKEVPVLKSRLHSDGKPPFGKSDWFIVMATLPTGQISNHYPISDWSLFDITEHERADEWDGHTAQDVADRLRRYLQGNDLAAPKSLATSGTANPPSSLPDEAAVRERIDHIFISNLTDNGLANEATDEIIDLIKSTNAATAAEAYDRGVADGVARATDAARFLTAEHIVTEAYRRGQTNGVAWSVKVLDDLHMADSSSSITSSDMIYKGAKNTIRDRYKAETGTDPAPKYPVKVQLQSPADSGEKSHDYNYWTQ